MPSLTLVYGFSIPLLEKKIQGYCTKMKQKQATFGNLRESSSGAAVQVSTCKLWF